MRAVLAVAAGVMMCGSARLAYGDDKKEDHATAIIGLWEITKAGGPVKAGSTIDFAKDGKLVLVVKDGEATKKLEGKYKIEKDKLTATLKLDDNEFDQTLTIKKLKGDDLELEDMDGGVDVLKRQKKKEQ